MNPFEQLKQVARQQHDENDFPEDLLAEVLDLDRQAASYAGREAEIVELAGQIENFDPYAGAGCFGESYSAAQIAAALRRLKAGR